MRRKNIDSSERFLDRKFWRIADEYEVDKAIRDGAKTDICDEFNLTVLHHAIKWSKSVKAIERLLNERLNLEAFDTAGHTPLHYAAATKTPEIIELLLDRGANATAITKDGHTPFNLVGVNRNLPATSRVYQRLRKANQQVKRTYFKKTV